jgi:glutamate-1-semialdehyde 2,1-aminomutase
MPQPTDKSREIVARAQRVMPGGVNSPVRAFKAVGGTPRIMASGNGAWMTDVDGNRYLDFGASWGPLLLGHTDPDVIDAVTAQAARGLTFGTTTEPECELAELVTRLLPQVEKIRFVSSGTEAVMSAIRLARGYTGRNLIAKFEGCYHGHSDYLLVAAGSGLATFGTPSSDGVPESVTAQTIILPLDDETALEKLFTDHAHDLAAVCIEGIPANNGLLIQRPRFMQRLRQLCDKHAVVLILDEVITGFRLGLEGAAGYYGITPDLACYGKVIGGGMPVGAFGGKAQIMDLLSPEGPVYQAGTLSGNPVTMAAGLATLRKLADGSIFERLNRTTSEFVDSLQTNLSGLPVSIVHTGSIFWLVFQTPPPRRADMIDTGAAEPYALLHAALLEHGIYFPPSAWEVCFVSVAHTRDTLRKAADTIAACVRQAIS